MEPDKLQQAWQARSSQTRVTVNAHLLQKEVLRNQRDFQALILRRDTIEITVGLLLLPYWIYKGLTGTVLWSWWLGVPALVWVIGFFIVDRRRHPQKPSDPGEPLLSCVEDSLRQVEHQIWLLRNVFWWYLLPFTIALTAFFGQWIWSQWIPSKDWWAIFVQSFGVLFIFGTFYGVYGFIYYLNQSEVRTQLEPRRRELLALAANLGGESAGGEESVFGCATGENAVSSRRHAIRVVLGVLATVAVVLPIAIYMSDCLDEIAASQGEQGFAWKSPFVAVRWHDSEPEVNVTGEWFKLVSLDGVWAGDIVAFSKKTYGKLWRKRFEEDLVELLTVMGHPPKDKVTLVVQPMGSDETRTLKDVPMTRANRRAIRNAAQTRERAESEK